MRIAKPVSGALRLSIYEGAAFGIYWNILLIIVINGFAVVFDATPIQFAMINALPLLTQVIGVLAAKIIQEKDIRKPFTLGSEALGRASWLLLLFVFVLPDNPSLKVWYVIGVTALSHTVHAGGVVGWLSWVSDLVPEEIRGIYFGIRGAIIGMIGLVGLSIASEWADGYKEKFDAAQAALKELATQEADTAPQVAAVSSALGSYLHVIFLLILIAVFFSLVSWILLAMQPVRKMKKLVTGGWNAIWSTINSPNGKRIAISWIAIFFATGITTGIYMQFFLNKLHISWQGIAVYIWIVTILSTALTPLMGRLSDRFGYRNLLLFSWGGVWWQPLLSVFCANDAPHIFGWLPWLVIADGVACGIFWPAVGISQNNIVIAETPSETRAGFFAILTAIGGVVGFGTAMLAGWLAGWLTSTYGEDATWVVAGVQLDNLRIPMVIGAFLRLLAGFLILAIKEPPRQKGQVTSTEAFGAIWKILVGKPVGGRLR